MASGLPMSESGHSRRSDDAPDTSGLSSMNRHRQHRSARRKGVNNGSERSHSITSSIDESKKGRRSSKNRPLTAPAGARTFWPTA
jgi:hypothetical protein